MGLYGSYLLGIVRGAYATASEMAAAVSQAHP
jgi:hypothetical protein